MTGEREFSVYQFFPGDDYERVLSYVGAEEAVKMAAQLSQSLGGRLGITQRIIITDGGDNIVFEWEFGKGVIFPPRGEKDD